MAEKQKYSSGVNAIEARGEGFPVSVRSHHQVLQTILCFALCLVFVFAMLVSPAAAQRDLGEDSDEWLGITGLIVDETMTKAGRDFYEYFSTYWQPIRGMDYTIYIEERADVIRGSQFWVKVDDDVVHQFRLSPRQGQIEELAGYTVSRVYGYLMQRLTVKKQLEELY